MKLKTFLWLTMTFGSAHAALENIDGDLEQQIQILDLKSSAVEESLREKVRFFHRIEMGSDLPDYLWSDRQSMHKNRIELTRYLKISIRETAQNLELLKNQRQNLVTEQEWQQKSLSKIPLKDFAGASTSRFQCPYFPASPSALRLELSQDFGRRSDPETGIHWNSLGWWIAGAKPEVKSCAAGVVVFSGEVAGRGRVLILDHGQAAMTLYANLSNESAVVFKKGESVHAGQILGSAPEKLYFEVRKKGLAVNPRLVFSSQKLSPLGL